MDEVTLRPAEASAAVATAEPVCVAEPQQLTSDEAKLLDHLLAMADEYRAEDAVRQAMEIYYVLVEHRAGTPQSGLARDRLLEIAAGHAAAGERHQARAIYERLL